MDTMLHQRSGKKLLYADSIDSGCLPRFWDPAYWSDYQPRRSGLWPGTGLRTAPCLGQEATELCFRCKATTDGAADAVCFGAGAIDVLDRLTRSR